MMEAGNIKSHFQGSYRPKLKPTEQSFAYKRPEREQKPECAFISSSPRIFEKIQHPDQEGEIGVFGAERYFSMKLEDPLMVHTKYCYEPNDNRHSRLLGPRSGPQTPSVKSYSSYNSKSHLLTSTGNRSPVVSRKANRTGILGCLGCRGNCLNGQFTKRSPDSGIKASKNYRVGDLHMPRIRKKNNELIAVTVPKLGRTPDMKIQGSFGLSSEKMNADMNLERDFSMISWDAIPKPPEPLQPPTDCASSLTFDDVDSDRSSDLFEIENITGTMFNPDYEPSEASIEWSVVTRSAADFSVASDFDEKIVVSDNPQRTAKLEAVAEKDVRRTRSSGLFSGCKSHKSVNVIIPSYKGGKNSHTSGGQSAEKLQN